MMAARPNILELEFIIMCVYCCQLLETAAMGLVLLMFLHFGRTNQWSKKRRAQGFRSSKSQSGKSICSP